MAVLAGADLARVEARVGRHLTAAEQHVAVEQIDALLNQAKDLLDAEIRREQARFAAVVAAGDHGRLELTARMAAILRDLRSHGRAHAANELHSMGYPVRTHAARKARLFAASDDELQARLRVRLGHLSVKIQDEAIGLHLGELAQDAIERALMNVLGARSIAADLIAPAFDAGLADTFEQHADLVDQWQYTSVLDAGTCDPCSSLDGTVYESWAAISEVLPDGGPNPSCDGGDRCRCRPLPMPS
jgi:hypothetical protein